MSILEYEKARKEKKKTNNRLNYVRVISVQFSLYYYYYDAITGAFVIDE